MISKIVVAGRVEQGFHLNCCSWGQMILWKKSLWNKLKKKDMGKKNRFKFIILLHVNFVKWSKT